MIKKKIYKDHKQGSGDKVFNPIYALLSSYVTIGVVFLIIIMKAYAYGLSGSVSLLGTLIDSLGDIVVSCLTLLSIRISLTPADEDHRYGHGKAEGFAALLQASFLIGASIFLAFETLQRLREPQIIQYADLGIAVLLISTALTIGLVMFQNYAYRRCYSLAVKVDQKHYISDVLLNLLVVFVLLGHLFDLSVYLDSFAGLAIAAFIGWAGYTAGKEAVDMLMDKEIAEQERQKIIETVLSHKSVHGMHDLRTRISGMTVYISFDVELDPDLTLREAHDITRDLDYELLKIFPNAEIIIHKDPHGDIYDPRHKVHGIHC